MNPLQELQTIIESLLFRIGDEQMPQPARAELILVSHSGEVMSYAFQLTRPGDPSIVIGTDIDVEGEGGE